MTGLIAVLLMPQAVPVPTPREILSLFREGRYKESAELASAYLTQHPTSADIRKVLGVDLFMLGRKEAAQMELERATELAPSDAEARYYLGRIYFERQNMPAALASFERTVQLDPRSVRGHNHRGQALEGLGRLDEARAAYLAAIELERAQTARSEWPYYNLGLLEARGGRHADAIPLFRLAIERNPSMAEAHLQLGVALAARGDVTGAEKSLGEAIRLAPNDATAHYQMGRLLTKTNQRERAREHLEAFERLRRK